MDTEKQRKREPMRRKVPMVGGLALLIVGNWLLLGDGIDAGVVRSVMASIAIISGALLFGLGVVSIRCRRWMFSIEDRLKKIEESSGHESNKQ